MLKPVTGQASALFSTVSGQAPGKARSNYLHALLDVGENKYEEALVSLDKAVNQYPKYAAALQLKGQILEMSGRREDARAAYLAAIEADPHYGKPMVQMAELAAEEQDSAEAVKWRIW